MRNDLLAWQWKHYAENHTTRGNLMVHVVSTPLFIASLLSLPVSIASLDLTAIVMSVTGLLVVLALQGRGHKAESAQPIPFLGPMDFVSRFVVEQCVTFPRFVLSGGFAKAWREAR